MSNSNSTLAKGFKLYQDCLQNPSPRSAQQIADSAGDKRSIPSIQRDLVTFVEMGIMKMMPGNRYVITIQPMEELAHYVASRQSVMNQAMRDIEEAHREAIKLQSILNPGAIQ